MKLITPSLLCAVGLTTLLTISCSVTVDPPATKVSQADLLKMPSFQATVLRVENGNVVAGGNQLDANNLAATLVTTNGRRIFIGGPQASAEMNAFVRSLQKQQVCTLPDAFVSFQNSQAGKKP
jgi:hypothetical protein